MQALIACWLAMLAGGQAIDTLAAPVNRNPLLPPLAFLTRMAAFTGLYLFWFGLSWRPLFALVAALITLSVLQLISNFKYSVLREPLCFTDLFLLPQILIHPDLYWAGWLHNPWFWSGVAALFAVIVGWYGWLEPSLVPAGLAGGWLVVLLPLPLLAGLALTVGLFLIAPTAPMRALYTRLCPDLDQVRDDPRFGLFATLMIHGIRWFQTAPDTTLAPGEPANPHWPGPAPIAKPATDAGPPVVIAIQSESFADLRGHGYGAPDLPNVDRLTRDGFAGGPLTVPAEGAWTMRSEFEFLTGQPLKSFLFDGLDPYMRAAFAPPQTLAHWFSACGFETVFVHPFDIRFFQRYKVFPRFGFDRMLCQDDFEGAERVGYYIADAAVTKKLGELVAAADRPLFVFVATMENHNPWGPGRLDDIHHPAEQYFHHVVNADAMLGDLDAMLGSRDGRSLLCFYGDHVPIMPVLANPLPDVRTRYVLNGYGFDAGPRDPGPRTLYGLSRDLVGMARKLL